MSLSALTISELHAESDRLAALIAGCETQLSDARVHLAAVRSELERRLRPSPEPRFTDHALLRFMERAMGIDIEALRRRLFNDRVKDAIRAGASCVIVEGVRFKIYDNAIVTVLDKVEHKPVPKDRHDEHWSLEEELENS